MLVWTMTAKVLRQHIIYTYISLYIYIEREREIDRYRWWYKEDTMTEHIPYKRGGSPNKGSQKRRAVVFQRINRLSTAVKQRINNLNIASLVIYRFTEKFVCLCFRRVLKKRSSVLWRVGPLKRSCDGTPPFQPCPSKTLGLAGVPAYYVCIYIYIYR